jgi:predicted acetyltransferase
MELVEPSMRYAESFRKAMEEFPPGMIEGAYGYSLEMTTDQYVERLRKDANGIDLPKGFVTSTTFWLIDGSEFIGHVNIRHGLTKNLREIGGHIGYAIRPCKQGMGHGLEILRQGLLKAKALGIDRMLITCDKDNVRSKKVIERNGGIFVDEFMREDLRVPKLRFRIDLP